MAMLVACSIVNDPSHRVGGDAGGFDAGTRDAGDRDGGSTDAGVADAGDVDAGDPIDAGPDGGLPRVEQADFCQRYAQAFCDAVPTCCSTVGSVPPDCIREKRESCQTVLADAYTDSRTSYDPVRAANVLEQAGGLVGGCATTTFLEWAHSRSGFYGAFVGSLSRGESCEPSSDLAELRVFCASPTDSCRGTSSRSCLAVSRAGMGCSRVSDCESGLRCFRPGPGYSSTGTCELMGEGIGSECRFPDECDSMNCSNETGFTLEPSGFTLGVCEEATSDWLYCP